MAWIVSLPGVPFTVTLSVAKSPPPPVAARSVLIWVRPVPLRSFTVTLSAAASQNVSVPFTLGGTAVAGTDYSGVTASPLVIPAGQTSATITGTLLDDGAPDGVKALVFTLGTPTGATLGSTRANVLTIGEPPSQFTVQFSAARESVNETAGTFSITVTLSAAASQNVVPVPAP